MTVPRTTSWDHDETTPAVSPTASAAVSRTPTLVDLPAHGLTAAFAEGDVLQKKSSQDPNEGQDDDEHLSLDKDRHHGHRLHLPHPHLPPHPHQHLEQYLPPDNYETTDELAREKEAAQAGAGTAGADPEKGPQEAAPVSAGPATSDYPDGGLEAWLVVAGAWCISFTAWGYANAYGVLLSYLLQNNLSDYTESDLAWIGAFQLFANLACAIFSGKAFDAGYVRHLMVAGLLVYTAGLFGLSYATTYWQVFLSQGLACGLASGLTFLPACSAVSHYFKEKRMFALGILATGSSLGGVMYPSMMNKLMHTIGWGWTIRAVGFINVGLIAFACLTVKSRLPPRRTGAFFDFKVFLGKPNLGFSLYVAGAAIVWLGLYTPFFYSEQYALFQGVSDDIAFYSLSILNAASVFGRTIPNYYADSFGPLNLLIPFTAAAGILLFCWIPGLMNTPGTIVWSLVFGAAQGAFVAMLPASVAALTDDMRTVGIRMAMAFFIQSFTALVGTPIAGYIISQVGGQAGYTGAGVYSGCVVLAGCALILAARIVVSRRRGTPWV
ncbi:uncharacterized protein JCM10292_007747 [Rhodotorula paludigena]|uniref:uncharacterized protein n=1 Tax=Rhodotorula paludigena TaxID=86838 RepID=UPI00317AFCC1